MEFPNELEELFFTLSNIESDLREQDGNEDYEPEFSEEDLKDTLKDLERLDSEWEVKYNEWLGW